MKALKNLLDDLEEIGMEHPEVEDTDVREMPDDGAKAEAGTPVQVALAREVEERERVGACGRKLRCDLVCPWVRHCCRVPFRSSPRGKI